jgi:hypothetical protein
MLKNEINDKSAPESASALASVRLAVFVSDSTGLLPKEIFCCNIATD